MKCTGKYDENERACNICKRLLPDDAHKCREVLKKKNAKIAAEDKKWKELHEFGKKCPYREQCWDEYTPFDGCTINGHSGRSTPSCEPTEQCKQKVNNKQFGL